MRTHVLGPELTFPPPERAPAHGLVAVGGDVTPARLLAAYSKGIFPWPHEGLPLLWFSPDPRMVLPVDELAVTRSLNKTIRQGRFTVTLDTAFEQVMRGCASAPRPGQDGTWITQDIIDGYCALYFDGYAHSIESWQNEQLVGGLYGISMGAAFFGESMFARVTDASKVAFVTLVRQLQRWGFHFVDCQVPTGHLARLGAQPWRRDKFLAALRNALAAPTRRGKWALELG